MYIIHIHTHKIVSTDVPAATDTHYGQREHSLTDRNKYKYICLTHVKRRKAEAITAHTAN